jgi:hypothetical protein
MYENTSKTVLVNMASLKAELPLHRSSYELLNTESAADNLLDKTRNTFQQYTSPFHKYVQQSVSVKGW